MNEEDKIIDRIEKSDFFKKTIEMNDKRCGVMFQQNISYPLPHPAEIIRALCIRTKNNLKRFFKR